MQAARGTSLSRDDLSPTRSRRPAPSRVRGVLAACFAGVYVVDQVTKVLAVAHLAPGVDKQLLGNALQLNLTRNAGAAFSTGTAYTALLSCLAATAVLVVVWLSRRLASVTWAVAFGFLLAGIGGNLTDRLVRAPGPLRGEVVDFLQLPHWPIFNVADMSINVAAAIILVQAYRGIRLDGTRVRSRRPGDNGQAGETDPSGQSQP